MANQPLAFAELLGGGVLLASALTGASVRDVIAGNAGPFKGFSIGNALSGTPAQAGQPGNNPGSNPGTAGGFLPKGAKYVQGRADQGRDFQTNAGGPIVAPGAGVILDVRSDPNGFGPAYPIVQFVSGPFKGKVLYIGHTISALAKGAKFQAGQILSHTGTSPVGNASVPGWAEIGYAPGGSPGAFGQPTPF